MIAKPEDGTYQPGKRAMFKIKHARTADCVVAGFRWHKGGADAVGSLLLGLYDDKGKLHHVGVTSSFTMETRKALAEEFEPLRKHALDEHPWAAGLRPEAASGVRDAGRAEPVERGQGFVVGAAADRARVRSEVRPYARRSFPSCGDVPAVAADEQPADCRYDQLEVTPPYELAQVFGAGANRARRRRDG